MIDVDFWNQFQIIWVAHTKELSAVLFGPNEYDILRSYFEIQIKRDMGLTSWEH